MPATVSTNTRRRASSMPSLFAKYLQSDVEQPDLNLALSSFRVFVY
jgi:hypothetical protein